MRQGSPSPPCGRSNLALIAPARERLSPILSLLKKKAEQGKFSTGTAYRGILPSLTLTVGDWQGDYAHPCAPGDACNAPVRLFQGQTADSLLWTPGVAQVALCQACPCDCLPCGQWTPQIAPAERFQGSPGVRVNDRNAGTGESRDGIGKPQLKKPPGSPSPEGQGWGQGSITDLIDTEIHGLHDRLASPILDPVLQPSAVGQSLQHRCIPNSGTVSRLLHRLDSHPPSQFGIPQFHIPGSLSRQPWIRPPLHKFWGRSRRPSAAGPPGSPVCFSLSSLSLRLVLLSGL